MTNAIDKFDRRADQINSLVCVGLDTDIALIPARFREQPSPQFAFNCWIIEQTHEYASAYKLNVAFYEARGDIGMRELKMTVNYLRHEHPDILTICDAKRADVGSTNSAYVTAIFDWLGFDAVTLHPYLGREALEPFLARMDKGCIILCRTSNPGAGEFQDLMVNGVPLWQQVAECVRDQWNANGNCMLVVNAIYPEEMRQLRTLVGDMTFLVPGIEASGGSVEQIIAAGLNSQRKGIIVTTARSLIFSDHPGDATRELRDEINRHR